MRAGSKVSKEVRADRPILGWGREVGTGHTVGFLCSLSSLIETRYGGAGKEKKCRGGRLAAGRRGEVNIFTVR